MCIITNHIHYVTKINQAFPITLKNIGRPGYKASDNIEAAMWASADHEALGYGQLTSKFEWSCDSMTFRETIPHPEEVGSGTCMCSQANTCEPSGPWVCG